MKLNRNSWIICGIRNRQAELGNTGGRVAILFRRHFQRSYSINAARPFFPRRGVCAVHLCPSLSLTHSLFRRLCLFLSVPASPCGCRFRRTQIQNVIDVTTGQSTLPELKASWSRVLARPALNATQHTEDLAPGFSTSIARITLAHAQCSPLWRLLTFLRSVSSEVQRLPPWLSLWLSIADESTFGDFALETDQWPLFFRFCTGN